MGESLHASCMIMPLQFSLLYGNQHVFIALYLMAHSPFVTKECRKYQAVVCRFSSLYFGSRESGKMKAWNNLSLFLMLFQICHCSSWQHNSRTDVCVDNLIHIQGWREELYSGNWAKENATDLARIWTQFAHSTFSDNDNYYRLHCLFFKIEFQKLIPTTCRYT